MGYWSFWTKNWHYIFFYFEFCLDFEKNPSPSDNISGNFIFIYLFIFFSLSELVIPSILLQKVSIGTLNRSNSSIQSVPNKFWTFRMTNAFNFFSFPLKKTFMEVSPINFNFSPVTLFAIFFFRVTQGWTFYFFQVSAFIIVKSDLVSIWNLIFLLLRRMFYIFSLYFFSCCLFSCELYPFFIFLIILPTSSLQWENLCPLHSQLWCFFFYIWLNSF